MRMSSCALVVTFLRSSANFGIACLAVAALSACSTMSQLPGDGALALATDRFKAATRDEVAEAFERVVTHLQVPPERRAHFAYVSSANFRKANDYVEFDELSQTVLLAAKGVKIGFAKNVLVIANGHVDIAHGAAVAIIAAGDIQLSTESQHLGIRPADGIYITKGSFKLSHGLRPTVYAVKGAATGNSTPTVYNTDVNASSGFRATSYTRGILFRDEPPRVSAPPHMVVNSGESMPYQGERCKGNGDAVDLLTTLLPTARRDADCPRLESAKVHCEEQAPNSVGRSRERWTFTGCRGRVDYFFVHEANLTTLNRAPGEVGEAVQRPAYVPPTGKVGQDRQALYREALAHTQRGELLEARSKYQAAFDLTGNDPYAVTNIASLNSQIARVDAKVAPYSKTIDSGRGTARDYADRGLAYVRANDVGRGLKDLSHAAAMNNSDVGIQVDLARGYLLANRLSEAQGVAGRVVTLAPKETRAYEISAWAQLLANTPAPAYRAAFSSLVEAPPWSRTRFAGDKAAYRVIAGYFALRACGSRDRANAWTRRWSEYMSRKTWPDVLALYLAGELEEQDVLAVATALKPSDEGSALADAHAFLALEEIYAGKDDRQRKAMNTFFSEEYAAGRTLALVVRTRLTTPGQQPRLRTPSEAACSS